MNDKNIIIKQRNGNMLIQGIVFLVMSVVSLIIAFLPYLSAEANKVAIVFYSIGGISFAVFFTLYIVLLYKEFKPADALILTSRGFTDIKNVGSDITIDWTNVSSVKLLGKKELPYLGINLENCDIVLAKMKKKEADEMRENIDENLPHILISQKDIRYSVKELKDLFVKFVREARILSNEAPKHTKNNPFTTDDVLRAFGKLPPENKDERKTAIDDSKVIEAPKTIEEKAASKSESAVISTASSCEEDGETDPFYALLQKQAVSNVSEGKEAGDSESSEPKNDKTVSSSQENEMSEEDMPEDMKELMARAKSSKISELGKILNEDAPISHFQPPKQKIPSDDDTLHIDLSDVMFDEKKVKEDQQISFDLTEDDGEKSSSAPTDSISDKKVPKKDDMSDTKEYFPDLLVVSDSFEESEDDDDSDFIIPEPIEYQEESEDEE